MLHMHKVTEALAVHRAAVQEKVLLLVEAEEEECFSLQLLVFTTAVSRYREMLTNHHSTKSTFWHLVFQH